MSANSKIEWTDHTFNPWEGCQKVGPGCDHCYAETRNARFGGGTAPNWGTGAPRRRTSPHNWAQPLRWNRECVKTGARQRVFCASLADVFDKDVPAAWRTDLWDLIEATPALDWLLLTKRIGNAPRMLPASWMRTPRANVWLGSTIVNQEEADRDIPKLLQVPARVRFLSMEPLLGPVDLRNVAVPAEDDRLRRPWDYQGYKFNALAEHDDDRFHQAPATIEWVIAGGESGPNARPMHPDWARSLRDQCASAGVPFLFKQWGEWRPLRVEEIPASGGSFDLVSADHRAPIASRCFQPAHSCEAMLTDPRYAWQCPVVKAGKKAAGRLLDGREWNGTPAP
jgi:protein gp37